MISNEKQLEITCQTWRPFVGLWESHSFLNGFWCSTSQCQVVSLWTIKTIVPVMKDQATALPTHTMEWSRGGTISNSGSISISIFSKISFSISRSISILSLKNNQDQDQYQDQYFFQTQYQDQDQYSQKSKFNISDFWWNFQLFFNNDGFLW